MPRRATLLQRAVSIPDVAEYHQDAESSLRLYFTPNNPSFVARFAGCVPSKVGEELADRISETDIPPVAQDIRRAILAGSIGERDFRNLACSISGHVQSNWRAKGRFSIPALAGPRKIFSTEVGTKV